MQTYQITATLSFDRGQFTDELCGDSVIALHGEFEVSCEGELMFSVLADSADESIEKLTRFLDKSPYTLVSHTTPVSHVRCMDCNETCESPEKAKDEHWGWSYGPEGTIWCCPNCLARREDELNGTEY